MTGLALLAASGVVALVLTEVIRAHRRHPLFGPAHEATRQGEAGELSDGVGGFDHNGGNAA